MNYGQLVQLAQMMSGQQPYFVPVGDVINKSGTFAATQDMVEQMRKLKPPGFFHRPEGPATIIPLVPREKIEGRR